MTYEPPEMSILGSVEELTLVFNKVGLDPDIFTPAPPAQQVVGSIIEV